MTDETHKVEPAEVVAARSYVAESFARCLAEIDQKAFGDAPSASYERGNLTQSSVQAAISKVGEAGLESFEVRVASKEERLGDLVIFEHTLEDGTFVQIQSEGPKTANTDEVIARTIFISFKGDGKTLEIPDSTLHLINTEWRNGDGRMTSLVDYRVNTFADGVARTSENMQISELRMVNPSFVWYDEGHDEYEEPKTSRLRIIEGDKLTNDKGELIFDLYDLLQEAWPETRVIIATPNIPMAQLGTLKTELTRNANGDNLDLDAVIYTSLKGYTGREETRWGLGWDDGEQVFVHIYTKEFFDSAPNARQVFDDHIVPNTIGRGHK